MTREEPIVGNEGRTGRNLGVEAFEEFVRGEGESPRLVAPRNCPRPEGGGFAIEDGSGKRGFSSGKVRPGEKCDETRGMRLLVREGCQETLEDEGGADEFAVIEMTESEAFGEFTTGVSEKVFHRELFGGFPVGSIKGSIDFGAGFGTVKLFVFGERVGGDLRHDADDALAESLIDERDGDILRRNEEIFTIFEEGLQKAEGFKSAAFLKLLKRASEIARDFAAGEGEGVGSFGSDDGEVAASRDDLRLEIIWGRILAVKREDEEKGQREEADEGESFPGKREHPRGGRPGDGPL